MTNAKHTPTPWNTAGRWAVQTRFGMHFDLYKSEYTIEQLDEVEANAAFIVRACNAHEELVKALERMEKNASALVLKFYPKTPVEDFNWIMQARSALRKARGE